jgi:hypothetical protein
MAAALPAGSRAYERHVTGLDRWITSIHRGAVLSKKVIQVADIALIAISIYQVAKMPVVPAGSSKAPPTILGTLPGGVAVGSAVSLPSLARALEAIRKLVAIGALDGALVAGVGSLGGGSGIALPELQRPTSLAVQSGQGAGGVGGGAGPPNSASGQPAARGPAADYAGVSGRVKTLPPGKSPNVYQANTPEEMTNLFNELSQGGRNVTPPRYKGTMVELPDGTLVGMRTGSKSGGPTIDVSPPKGSNLKLLKVHLP